MINWNEVKVGETVVCRGEKRMLVLAMDLPWIWCKYMLEYKTLHKDHFHDWTIYDPWDEITEECEIDDSFNIRHKGSLLHHSDIIRGRYKKGPGLRVWKRKEHQS